MEIQINNVKAKITKPISYHFVGCVYYGDPFHSAKEWSYENEIGHLWNRFMHLSKKYAFLLQKLNKQPGIGFEIHLEPEEFKKTRKYYVFVGFESEFHIEIPYEFFEKTIPYVSYLEFTSKATSLDFAEFIFKEWLIQKDSEYIQAFPFVIQRYDKNRFNGLEDPNSEIDWLIPLKSSKGDLI